MPPYATICVRVGSSARPASAMNEWHARRLTCMRESSTCNLRTLVRISSIVVHSLLPLLYRRYRWWDLRQLRCPKCSFFQHIGGFATDVWKRKVLGGLAALQTSHLRDL